MRDKGVFGESLEGFIGFCYLEEKEDFYFYFWYEVLGVWFKFVFIVCYVNFYVVYLKKLVYFGYIDYSFFFLLRVCV